MILQVGKLKVLKISLLCTAIITPHFKYIFSFQLRLNFDRKAITILFFSQTEEWSHLHQFIEVIFQKTDDILANYFKSIENKTKVFDYSLERIPLVAWLLKNLPAMWETWVQSLGWEDPLEKGTIIYSSILAWKIPWTV